MKVLPTAFRDVFFRSRLEARWAIYFDLLKLNWQYEPEGYSLPEGNYLPDFYVSMPPHEDREDYGFYVEVKSTEEEREKIIPKLESLERETGENVFCVVGPPSTDWQWGGEWGKALFCEYTFNKYGKPYFFLLSGCEEENSYFSQTENSWRIASNYRFENGIAN